jgi:CBS domain-containing protein
LREAGELMLAYAASHLVVVQAGSQRPLGILSTGDIVGVLACGEA